MARWDDESFNTETPPDNIQCATCKFKLKPITVAGYTQERWGYNKCNKYEVKPQDVNWGREPCEFYEEE